MDTLKCKIVACDSPQHESGGNPLADTKGTSAGSREWRLWGSGGALSAPRVRQHSAPRTATQSAKAAEQITECSGLVSNCLCITFHKNKP